MSRDWRWAVAALLVAVARLHPYLLPAAALGLAVAAWAWWRAPDALHGAALAALAATCASLLAGLPLLSVLAWAGAVILVTARPQRNDRVPTWPRQWWRLAVPAVAAVAATVLAAQPWDHHGSAVALLAVAGIVLGRPLALHLQALGWTASPVLLAALVPWVAGAGAWAVAAAALETGNAAWAARSRLAPLPLAASGIAGLVVLAWR